MKTKTKQLAIELAKIADKLEGEIPVPTRLAWGLLIEKPCGIMIKNQHILDFAQIFFPGFDNTMPATGILVYEKLVQPALFNQHPSLIDFSTAAEAEEKLGEIIYLHPIKKSSGEEWQEWIEIIEPGFVYAEWRKQ